MRKKLLSMTKELTSQFKLLKSGKGSNWKTMLLVGMATTMLLTGCSAKMDSTENKSDSASEPPSVTEEAGGIETESTPSDEMDYGSTNQEAEQNEEYLDIIENDFQDVSKDSLLTFSLKVDTASYSNVERYIKNGELPPVNAVKTEEIINYFNYDEQMPDSVHPFSLYTELGKSPFDSDKYLAFIRVKSRDIDKDALPGSNLTFLIDTSGSMDSYDKLPLMKSAFKLLVENLGEKDKVSIVTYAGSSDVVLNSVSGSEKDKILDALDNLFAGGSTGGAEGIMTAYELAEKNFVEGGNNRVILATDGDFNVGPSSVSELEKLVAAKRDSGVYLSILGFGTGNLKDDRMETMAKNGNGNYSYIDSTGTAKKVLVDELGSNLFTIADDVKAQVEFNYENVKSYRLIGYENRMLDNKDFNDDSKDAGEIGIGTDVVVLFELELQNGSGSSDLKYGGNQSESEETTEFGNELFEVRIRYKNPGDTKSHLILEPVTVDKVEKKNSSDYYFAASAAGFGHLLRNSDGFGDLSIDTIIEMAEDNLGKDKGGYRYEFVRLLHEYKDMN